MNRSEPDIKFRPVDPGDVPFLCQVYASTRQEELAVTDWTEDQKTSFLEQQFHAQRIFYEQQFPRAAFQIITVDGTDIGRLYLDRRDEEIRIIDITLLPQYHGAGIGSRLMKDILAEATEAGLPVRIHVETSNPAMRLYSRLGFREVDDQGVYRLMEWRPALENPVTANRRCDG